jgi:hypothetical protein
MIRKIEDEINKIIDSLINLKELVRNNQNDPKNSTYKVGRFTVTDLPFNNNNVYRIKSGGKTNKFYKLSKKNKTRAKK